MKMTCNSLRSRLVLLVVSLAMGTCTLYSLGMLTAFDFAEDRLFDARIRLEVAGALAQYEQDPGTIERPRPGLLIHAVRSGDVRALPASLAALAPGDDEILIDGREHHVERVSHGDSTLYFLFDESEFEAFEQLLLISLLIVSACVVAVAAWIGVVGGRRLTEPLFRLTEQVRALDAAGTVAIDLSAQTRDEVSVLTRAINSFQQRAGELLRREREFSADVSHELRTPLMSVQGAAELLRKRTQTDPGALALIARIERGCQQMATLTEALLFLARDPQAFSAMLTAVDVGEVVRGQIAAMHDITDSRGVVVNVTGSARKTVRGVPAILNIVIGNILKNAVKYTDRGTVNVILSDAGVVIEDYGPGIDAAAQATMFERCNRGSRADTDGAGIGLALVRRFCEQYGWIIDLQSVESEGTRVAVVF
ncbi:MAG: HAMP domain-containing histidine kinase [Gammaproteobacteria bacterium]|nr:HAMP domain-containing histidine kinase [Gammaproteobacteria bacterium]